MDLDRKRNLLIGVEIVGFNVTGPRDMSRVIRIHLFSSVWVPQGTTTM